MNVMEYMRTEKKELSFYGERLLRGRHRIHPYPAMLHPLLANFLISQYAKRGDIIFDPFCGSGVTLLQSKINGYKSFGFDINPMAIMIARAKSLTYNKKKLYAEFKDLRESLFMNAGIFYDNSEVDIPPIKNIDYWYLAEVAHDLGKIRWILKNRDYEYRDFFTVIFALICRTQSLTKKGEFKRHRIKQEKITNIKNDALQKFLSHVSDMIEVFTEDNISKSKSEPILANSENKIPPSRKYDLVITSPPYGDSRTTVAYGQYTSFGSEWVNGLNGYSTNNYKVDSECLGVKRPLFKELDQHNNLMEIYEKIKAVDSKRAYEVLHFFNGYYGALKNIAGNLNEKGRICFVVGNRTVKGFQIPMDQITASFFDSMGLVFEEMFVREIHNKVMPSKNSPTNKPGMKSKTMTNEYIIIFRRG